MKQTVMFVFIFQRSYIVPILASQKKIACHKTLNPQPLKISQTRSLQYSPDSKAAPSWAMPIQTPGRTKYEEGLELPGY